MNLKKFISGVSALTIAASAFAGMAVTASAEATTITPVMTYVDYSNPSTAMGVIAAGDTARSGYNKISGGKIAFANTGWGVNYITFLKIDASSVTGTITSAKLTFDGSGSSDNKRACTYGAGYASNTAWDPATLTYNEADTTYDIRSITTVGSAVSTTSKSATTFESKEIDILAAFANDADNIVTIAIYETAAAGGYIKNPSVAIEASASTAAYSISYKYNNETIYSDAGTQGVGGTVAIQSPITVDGVKYYAVDGTASEITIDAVDANNNVDVTLRQADTFTASLVNSANNATIASSQVTEGEGVTLAYPNKALIGTTLYTTTATNKEYRRTFSNVAANVSDTLTYTSEVENCVFYSEGEDIEGTATQTYSNVLIRSSNAKVGSAADADVTITTLEPGYYTVYGVEYINSSAGGYLNFTAGDTTFKVGQVKGDSEATTTTAATNWKNFSQDLVITESTPLVFNSDNAYICLDYIYIVKTGDVPATEEKAFTFGTDGYVNMSNYTGKVTVTVTEDGVAPVSKSGDLPDTIKNYVGDLQLAIVITGIPSGASVTTVLE